LNSREKRVRDERGRSVQEKSKQKRLRDERFAAANAHEDAKRAKKHLMVPKIGQNKHFNGCIDLTTVRHFVSSEYQPPVSVAPGDSPYTIGWSAALLEGMFENARPFYTMMVESPVDKDKESDESSDKESEVDSSLSENEEIHINNRAATAIPLQVIG